MVYEVLRHDGAIVLIEMLMRRLAPDAFAALGSAPRIEQPQHLLSVVHHANPATARQDRRHHRLLRVR